MRNKPHFWSFVADDPLIKMMIMARSSISRKKEKGLMLLFFVIACVSGNGIPPQEFIRQPPDKTAVIGGHIILPCQVKNKRGMLQWTRDGFGLDIGLRTWDSNSFCSVKPMF